MWFKAQRQGNVQNMENRVASYHSRDPDVWDFFLHPNGIIYDNPGGQTDLRVFRYADMVVQKAGPPPIRYQDYEEVKVVIKCDETVDGMLCFLSMPANRSPAFF